MLFFPDKREILDPTIFNDDLALKIDWSPVSYSNRSTSGCTHKIQENDGNTLKLKTTTKGVFPFLLCYIFSILFLLGTFIFWIT